MAEVSSHAARAEGSTGHADGGSSFGEGWTLLEEVFPMAMGGVREEAVYHAEGEDHRSPNPRFSHGDLQTSTED